MKAVLMSIQPQYVEKIISGKKTIEVRKTCPKLETPFKCYIYCTKGQELWGDGTGETWKGIAADEDLQKVFELNPTLTQYNGKVIGEFICDRIEKYTTELNDGDCYEDIRLIWVDDDGEEDFEIITTNGRDNPDNCILLKDACLTFADLKKYLYKGKADIITFYGWHISDLKIYDKPRELSEFRPDGHCLQWDKITIKENIFGNYVDDCYKNSFCTSCCKYYNHEFGQCNKPYKWQLTRPPQSWCYVEEL